MRVGLRAKSSMVSSSQAVALGYLLQTTTEWNSRDIEVLDFILKGSDFSLQNLLLDSISYCKIAARSAFAKDSVLRLWNLIVIY